MVFAAVLFAISIGLFFLYYASNASFDKLLSVKVINESSGARSAFLQKDSLLPRFDYLVFAVFIGLMLAFLISSFFVAGHPVFMFIYFIVGVVAVILSALLSNVWYSVTNMPQFLSTLAVFKLTNIVMLKLPFVVGIVVFLGIVIMFAKPQSGGSYYG